MKRKTPAQHKVTRKTKSGKVAVFMRGKGSKQKKSGGKKNPTREDDEYDKQVEQGYITPYEAELLRSGRYAEEIKKIRKK